MAKFKKLVVTPGTFNVGRLDGRSEVIPLTKDRLKTWVQETRKLMALGISVPAPFAHQDKDRNFPLPVRMGTDGASISDAYSGGNGISWDAQINGGFWDNDLEIDPTTGGIMATVDAPGDENDVNSPAGKVGKTVKETSVLVMGPRKIVDAEGKEHEIGEHLAHIAMCLHPAQHGQRNFEPVPPAELADPSVKLAMSFCMADLVGETAKGGLGQGANSNTLPDPTKPQDQELADALAMLRNVTFIDLPETTTREDFLTNLSLALRQKSADQQETQRKEETMTQRPDGAATQSPSIAMSNLLNNFKSGTTIVSQESPAPTAADTTLAIFMNQLVGTKKKSLKDRITALVSTGRVKKTYADSKLFPRVDALAMSPAQLTAAGGDVNAVRDPLEDIIEGLEETAPLTGPSQVDSDASWDVPGDANVQSFPQEMLGNDLSDADSDEIANASLAGSGLV